MANEELLQEKLHLIHGCVNPFAIRHSPDDVELFLDTNLLNSEEKLLFHPMTNNCVVAITAKELKTFVHRECCNRFVLQNLIRIFGRFLNHVNARITEF
jgi:hypothetical protein